MTKVWKYLFRGDAENLIEKFLSYKSWGISPRHSQEAFLSWLTRTVLLEMAEAEHEATHGNMGACVSLSLLISTSGQWVFIWRGQWKEDRFLKLSRVSSTYSEVEISLGYNDERNPRASTFFGKVLDGIELELIRTEQL